MVDDLKQTVAAAMSSQPIRVRAQPRQESKIDDHYYMSKCDSFVHDDLKAVQNPTLADLERLFYEFEHDFLDDPEMDPMYRAVLDEMDPQETRMQMVRERYTE